MISQRDLSLISNDLYKDSGGRRIPDQTIELDYALGWFLSELSQNPFGTHLAFKGGTALRRCYFGEYRFSEDLDFTLLNSATFDEVVAAFDEVGPDGFQLFCTVWKWDSIVVFGVARRMEGKSGH